MKVQFPTKKSNTASLRSLHSLSSALDISLNDLLLAQSMPSEKRYEKIELKKINGDIREVYDPHYLIRKIQKRINNRLFKKLILWPDYLFGSIPSSKEEKNDGVERHYIACAKKHCYAKTILKVDIRSFFDNIHRDVVQSIFKHVFKYKGDALKYLVDICCYDERVVQGALTSSYIASLCLFDVEYNVFKRAERKGLVYTRLVDDITVSSKVVSYNMNQILDHIKNMLTIKDLPINEDKTKVYNISTESLKVHGLRVSFDSPRLPSDEVGKIKASVHNIEKLSTKNNSITSAAYRIEYNRCMGRVNKLGRLGHNKHKIFLKRLKKIPPKASKKDLIKLEKAVKFLEASFKLGNYQKFYYKKKYDLTMYGLIILKRTPSYSVTENSLRDRLMKVKY
ncbi:reverse transcriptase family protein [Pectobacterium polaris]|uniref:reverse transcriptase family protein n=1 Tax=Pectobacterium polaris TaxID=2042057 RepID=UPI0032E3B64B